MKGTSDWALTSDVAAWMLQAAADIEPVIWALRSMTRDELEDALMSAAVVGGLLVSREVAAEAAGQERPSVLEYLLSVAREAHYGEGGSGNEPPKPGHRA